jgi:hypothetical protein
MNQWSLGCDIWYDLCCMLSYLKVTAVKQWILIHVLQQPAWGTYNYVALVHSLLLEV